MLKLVNPKIKDRFLVNENKEIPLIKFPIGCIATQKALADYSLIYEVNSNGEKLIANSNNSSISIELLPTYFATDFIIYDGREIEVVIRGVMEDIDYYIANSIIESTHYLKPPYKGLTIIAEFKNKKDKEFILKRNSNAKNNSNEFEKMIVNFSNIAGCAVIDQMAYANPKGRMKIAKELNCDTLLSDGVKWDKNHRDEVLRLLNVAWISRFAIVRLYQDLGIGTVLAKHASIAAATKRIPHANYVEVFTTHTKERAKEILETNNKGFLKKAGYIVYNELLHSKPMYNYKDNNFSVYKKLYYYKKVDGLK